MTTPDFTPEAIVGLSAGAIDVAVQFGVHVTADQSSALLAFIGLLAAFVLGSAHVRNGRSRVAAAQAAVMPDPSLPLDGTPTDTATPPAAA